METYKIKVGKLYELSSFCPIFTNQDSVVYTTRTHILLTLANVKAINQFERKVLCIDLLNLALIRVYAMHLSLRTSPSAV